MQSKTYDLLLLENLKQKFDCDLLWFIVAILKNRLNLSERLLTQAVDIGSLWKPVSVNGKNFLNV